MMCPPCEHGVHTQCDQHINDGLISMADELDVECDCPCEGTIFTPIEQMLWESFGRPRESDYREEDT